MQPLTRPRRLTAGDRVVVVAPSGPMPKDRLDAGCEILRDWGLDVVVASHVTDQHEKFDYLAGADEHRAADLQEAWCDPSVAAVLCARGGYGAQRMMDLLDWSAMAAAEPKVFAGFSDITALHEAFANCLGVATLHGPMVASTAFIDDVAGTAEHFRQTLFEPESVMTLTSPTAQTIARGDPSMVSEDGTVSGVTIGGCISMLAAELATPTGRPNISGGILLLEDVDEDTYRLDRYITHMLRTGWLDGVAAVVLGSWHNCGALDEVVLDRFGDLGVPVVSELGFGHGEGTLTVPLGIPATLDTKTSTLTLDTPALA
ncbi:LD-carboxypeptidase [Actinobacteria bacterium YIM 96077]|uniref:LD-carboxypeptidase n=1 Tax=Phytoactinopolyspora halophila TaxID=1981511 RepID=A0A329R0S6_9ACTN|nr:LD-carboxypeptidase [Actinobacteria bacterium YIM 96077]RAW16528.1 LD-carboxypeptidase [Phytoactinopolyspora halophila]